MGYALTEAAMAVTILDGAQDVYSLRTLGNGHLQALPGDGTPLSVPVHTHADNTQGGNTLTIPTIADFTNAQHDHSSAAMGGAIPNYVGATVSLFGVPGLVPGAPFDTGRSQILLGNGLWTTFSGDWTNDGSGVATIAAKAVTLAKMADMATASLIYRKTAGSGAPEVNTLATLKTDLGLTGTNSGDQTITLTGDVTGGGTGSFATTIASHAVTYAKMQQVATTQRLLGLDGTAPGDIAELSITNVLNWLGTTRGDIVHRSLSSWGVLSASTDAYPLCSNGASAGLTYQQLRTAGITDAAVTYAKIQNVSATTRLLGRSSSGAGVIEELTLTNPLTISAGAVSAATATTSTPGIVQLATDGDTSSTHAVVGNDSRMEKGVEQTERYFRSMLPNDLAGIVSISGTAYAVYVGRTTVTMTPKHVYMWLSALGSGTQTAEIGLFSSPAAPSRAGQTLTKLVATGTVDGLISVGTTGVKGNTSAFSTSVAAGTYLWGVFRVANATTQPTIFALTQDNSQGNVLSVTGASALTSMTTQAFALITASAGAMCPDLIVTLD
jgi:hypothetical protein